MFRQWGDPGGIPEGTSQPVDPGGVGGFSRPPGATNHKKHGNLRIQGRMQFFRKMSQKALNRDLTLPEYGRGPARQSPQKYGFTKQKHIRGDKTLKI